MSGEVGAPGALWELPAYPGGEQQQPRLLGKQAEHEEVSLGLKAVEVPWSGTGQGERMQMNFSN